eukprot:351422-Chlamydomonas_euryale.AAC.3
MVGRGLSWEFVALLQQGVDVSPKVWTCVAPRGGGCRPWVDQRLKARLLVVFCGDVIELRNDV